MMGSPPFDFSIMFENMPIPRFILRVDNGKIADVLQINALALKYFNTSVSKVIGFGIESFMDVENVRHFQQSFEVCLSRKRTVTIQALPTMPGDLKVYGFWVNPVLDSSSGEVLYLDILGQLDVRDQSILQRERDDAISLLASIFEVSEVGIIVTNEVGNVVKVNDSFIRTYGWTRDEIVGSSFVNLIADEDKEIAQINHKKFISVGVRGAGEVKVLRKSGGNANVLFTSAMLRLSQNRRFLVMTVMDITLRKQMEHSLRIAKDQADAANRAKSTFLANMSHELRTPMNAIIGFSELMMKETFGPVGNDKYREYLDDIHMSAEHLLEIINEVLDMSKIEAGRLDLLEDVFSVDEMIDSVCRMMSSRVFASGISLVETVPDHLPPIRADYRLIRQVLINLLTNAIKFSRPEKTIEVSANINDKNDMVIVVRDEGVGIQKDKIDQALEPFGQVNDRPEKRDANQQGTGLGLPLAKAMVEMHDGLFEIASEVDVGTTITITLPAYRVLHTHDSPL